MRLTLFGSLTMLLLIAAPAAADVAVDLRGSPGSMTRQHQIARANDFTFLRTASQIGEFVEKGFLVPVEGNADYEVLKGVSHPYARPELLTFIERLSRQHVDACGERLVVTSLTRPTTGQPSNSHPLSVHPTGMAVDLRVLKSSKCRGWLEDTLLGMENAGLLDVTRERRPPHYHIAVFPEAYREYVAPLIARDSARAKAARLLAARETRDASIRERARLQMHRMSPETARGKDPLGLRGIATLAALPLVLGGLAVHARRKNRDD